jgi:hypothetical protein
MLWCDSFEVQWPQRSSLNRCSNSNKGEVYDQIHHLLSNQGQRLISSSNKLGLLPSSSLRSKDWERKAKVDRRDN